jgi:TonB-linked SusC/RagA family outer membrane protein
MKKQKCVQTIPRKNQLKLLRIMKLTLVCLLLGTNMIWAGVTYSQVANINLNLDNVALEKVFDAIRRQSEFEFFYSNDKVNTSVKVSVQAKNAKITEVLDQILPDVYEYRIDDRYILISKKNEAVLPMQPEEEESKLKGRVTDTNGEALPGVTILIVGSTRGVISDEKGNFEMDNVAIGTKLTASQLGMQTKEFQFQGKGDLIIVLEENTNELDEVTIVAFGKQKKESVVASITTVNTKDLKVSSSNLTTALSGRIAGVISYQRSGEPGQDNAQFFIRGVTTFGTGKADPLILIDGVELSTNDLARLNVDDIASFSVMKDANATALYGARGANGVILVTSKEGKEGPAKFSFRMENAFSAPTQRIELADPFTYMRVANEAARVENAIPYSSEKIANTGVGNPYVYPYTDWQELLFKDYTSNQRFNMNVSGGGKIARYYVAASYDRDNGLLKVDKRNNFNNNIALNKYSLRSNVNINLTPTTELIVRLHGSFDDYKGPLDGGSALYTKSLRASPVGFPPYYPADAAHQFTDHILFGSTDDVRSVNPYADMVKGYREYSKSLVLAQFELKQNLDFLVKGLSLRGLFNTTRYSYYDLTRSYGPFFYTLRDQDYDKLTDTYTLFPLNEVRITNYEPGYEELRYNAGAKDVTSTIYYEAAVQYDNTFDKKHQVSGLLILTGRNELRGNAGDLQSSLAYRNIGLAGRLTYGFDSRFFIEGNFGYNGSERFAKEHRYGFFPSAGLGYLISNETFWEPLQESLSKLKLKATYGLVGNDAIGNAADRFFYLSNVNLDNSGTGYSFGSDFTHQRNGVSISRYSDPNITWETSYKQNYGIELGLFNQLEIQADYFRETRKNILMARASIPVTMGLQATPSASIGESFSSGIDVSLDYSKVFTKDLWMTARGNFTYATSQFQVYEEPQYENTPYRSRIGHSISSLWGYVAERLFIDDEDVKNSPFQSFDEYGPGDIKYKDLNGDDKIDEQDRIWVGFPSSPEIIYGAGFSAGYRNFDLSMFFQGSARSSFWIDARQTSPFIDTDDDGHGNNDMNVLSQNQLLKVIADNHWSENNPDPHALWPRLSFSREVYNNTQYSTWWLRDGSFVRLKTLELGYTLPEKITQKMGVGPLRLYLMGSNLFLWSKFKLWDPEMGGNGLGYPLQRVVSIGININL